MGKLRAYNKEKRDLKEQHRLWLEEEQSILDKCKADTGRLFLKRLDPCSKVYEDQADMTKELSRLAKHLKRKNMLKEAYYLETLISVAGASKSPPSKDDISNKKDQPI